MRMTISVRLISSEKITLVMPCFTEHDRAKSSPSVELWVGIIDRLGQVHVVRVVDLDTAHRDARHRTNIDNEP